MRWTRHRIIPVPANSQNLFPGSFRQPHHLPIRPVLDGMGHEAHRRRKSQGLRLHLHKGRSLHKGRRCQEGSGYG